MDETKKPIRSERFNENLFLRLSKETAEEIQFDNKSQVYKCDSDDNTFEFIKDMIAFANVARRVGQPCYVLFGVDEGNNRKFIDVRNQYPGRNKPKGWDNPNVSPHDKQGGVIEQLRQIIDNWIDPVPEFRFEYGELLEDDNYVFVSYIEILPSYTSKPFSLKRSHTKGGTFYQKGTIFIRRCSSTVLLEDSQASYLLSISEAEYLNQQEWREIVNFHLSGEFEIMNNLTPSFEHTTYENPSKTALSQVVEELEAGKRIILVRGSGGVGKSVLLYRLTLALANKHNLSEITKRVHFGVDDSDDNRDQVISVIEQLEVSPYHPVPIFISLRKAFTSSGELEKQILSDLNQFLRPKKQKHGILKRTIERLFNIPGSRWILLMDGLDELQVIEESHPIFCAWIKTLPDNVQVVITTRPNMSNRLFNNPHNITVHSLTNSQVMDLLRQEIFASLDKIQELPDIFFKKVEMWLDERPHVLELITNFRAFKGFVSLLTSSIDVNKPRIDQDIVSLESSQERINDSEKVDSKIVEDSQPLSNIPKISIDDLLDDNSKLDTDDLQNEDIELPQKMDGIILEDSHPLSSVPKISVDYLLNDNNKPNIDDLQNEIKLPSTAIAIQSITDYVQSEEIKRKEYSGRNPTSLADDAEIQLKKLAWKTSWNELVFNPGLCIKKRWISRRSLE